MKSFSWVGHSSKCPCPGTWGVLQRQLEGSCRRRLSLGQSSAVSSVPEAFSLRGFYLVNYSLPLPTPSGELASPEQCGFRRCWAWGPKEAWVVQVLEESGSLRSAHLSGLGVLSTVCSVFPNSCWAAALLHLSSGWTHAAVCLGQSRKGPWIQCPE